MEARQIAAAATSDELGAPTRSPNLMLRTPPNWTAVLFFAALGGIHLSMGVHAFAHRRWEGFLGLTLGAVFVAVSLVCWLVCREMTIERDRRRIRLRTGYRRLSVERFVPFRDVRGVRVTLPANAGPLGSRVEVLCANEDLECPPTVIPRQEALCLSVLMSVPLIKVLGADERRAEMADLSRPR